jgi:hypothetical protein
MSYCIQVREVRDEINAVLSSLTTMKKALQVRERVTDRSA